MIYLNSILHKFSEFEMTSQESLCLIVQRCSKLCLLEGPFREDGKGEKTCFIELPTPGGAVHMMHQREKIERHACYFGDRLPVAMSSWL